MVCQSPDAALSCCRQLGREITLLFLPKICFLAVLKFYPFRVTCNQSTHFPLHLSPKLSSLRVFKLLSQLVLPEFGFLESQFPCL